ncbi:OmpA family protein [Flagellimonas sp. S3867]|uniref:OmpA family protein n=1 Tax=Flagellimonas sp. S3867 TaxID=2768063 RepID=UPI0016846AF9|nr:OmpA family protein [Flagellimonas sp. S3867]
MEKLREVLKRYSDLSKVLLGGVLCLVCISSVEYIVGNVRADKALRIDNDVFGISLSVFILTVSSFIVLIRNKRVNRGYLMAVLIGPIFGSLVLLLASIRPGSGPILNTINVPYEKVNRDSNLLVLPVIFDNGSSTLKEAEKVKLLNFTKLFKHCETHEILVRGYASSRQFKEQSNHRNYLLANERAEIVAGFLKLETGKNFKSFKWGSFQEMLEGRRINDLDPNDDLIPELELLNRRVEIVWKEDECLQSFAANKASELVLD